MVPIYGCCSTTSRLQSHYKETVYFLPLSPQKFLVLIWSTLEGWNPRNFWYSCDRLWKDEALSHSWSYPVVLQMGPLNWETRTLNTRQLRSNSITAMQFFACQRFGLKNKNSKHVTQDLPKCLSNIWRSQLNTRWFFKDTFKA